MAKTLEEFFKTRESVPGEYVLDPNRAENPVVREKLKKAISENEEYNKAQPTVATSEKTPEGGQKVTMGTPIDLPAFQTNNVQKNTQTVPEEESPLPSYRPRTASAPTPSQGQPESKFPWDRALIGATPLLVGLLTHNNLEGTQTAANYFVGEEGDRYKRGKDLEGKLAELKAKRELASTEKGGSKRYQAVTIALKDGQNVKATFDTYNGQYLMPDGSEIPSNHIRAGYAVNPEEFNRRKDVSSEHKRDDADYLGTNTRIDPTTGQLGVVRNGEIAPIRGQSSGQLNVKNEKDIKDAQKEFTGSQAYKDATQALQLAPQVTGLLDAAARDNDPNSIAGSAVTLTLIRQAQRVGVASDKDAQAFGGTQQYEETLKRLEDKLLGTGKPLTARDVNDLREVSNIYTRRAKQLLGDYYTEKKGSFASRYNLHPEIIDQHIGAEVRPYMGTADSTVKAKNAPIQAVWKGKVLESPSRDQKLLIERDGKPFWTDSKWEDVKKQYPNAKKVN
jgi:hypothetical protein